MNIHDLIDLTLFPSKIIKDESFYKNESVMKFNHRCGLSELTCFWVFHSSFKISNTGFLNTGLSYSKLNTKDWSLLLVHHIAHPDIKIVFNEDIVEKTWFKVAVKRPNFGLEILQNQIIDLRFIQERLWRKASNCIIPPEYRTDKNTVREIFQLAKKNNDLDFFISEWRKILTKQKKFFKLGLKSQQQKVSALIFEDSSDIY